MSICAITTGNQNCQAIIKWLRQDMAIDVGGKDICSLDLIVEVQEGTLEYLYLYVPYNITYLENRTLALLDENNKYHYKKRFKIISKKSGEVNLHQLITIIKQVSISSSPTRRGTKVTIHFSKPVPSGQHRGVRILSEWVTEAISFGGNVYNTSLRYYVNNDARFLGLAKALHVRELAVYLIFPPNALINRDRPKCKGKTWKKPFDLSIIECLFGSRTTSIFSKLNRKCCEWIKSTENNEPALSCTPWTTFHIDCDYKIHKPEEEEKSETSKAIEKFEYKTYLSHPSGFGVDSFIANDAQIKTKYLRNKEDYEIIVYLHNVEKKVTSMDEGKMQNIFKPIELNVNVLKLLVLFLKYKDTHLPYVKLYNKAWTESIHSVVYEEEPDVAKNNLKNAVSTLRNKFEDINGFKIPNASGEGYVCKGNFRFCLILKESQDQWYTLEEV